MTKHVCSTEGMSNCDPCMRWRVELWDAIDMYVRACGGDPESNVGSYMRMAAVVQVENSVVRAAVNDLVRQR